MFSTTFWKKIPDNWPGLQISKKQPIPNQGKESPIRTTWGIFHVKNFDIFLSKYFLDLWNPHWRKMGKNFGWQVLFAQTWCINRCYNFRNQEAHLLNLLGRCTSVLGDGTFKATPKPYDQLCIIFGDVDEYKLPLVYSYMNGKSVPQNRFLLPTLERKSNFRLEKFYWLWKRNDQCCWNWFARYTPSGLPFSLFSGNFLKISGIGTTAWIWSKESIAARSSNDNGHCVFAPGRSLPKDGWFLFPPHDPVIGFDLPRIRRNFEILSPNLGVHFPDFHVERFCSKRKNEDNKCLWRMEQFVESKK